LKASGDKRGRSKPGKKGGSKAVPLVAAVPTVPDWWDAKWQARLDREQKAREKEARRLGMSVGHLDAIQESRRRNFELKKLQAKYDEPDLAGRNCLELLDLVPHGTSSPWPSDELREIVIKAADKMLEVSASQERSERERGIASMTLAYLVEVVAKRAFAAIRTSPKGKPNDATQYLIDALVGCCAEFRELAQEGPERFKPWSRKRLFLPSLRAYTSAYKDDFDKTKCSVELAAGIGVNLRGKARLKSAATLKVAKCLLMAQWRAEEEAFPKLSKDTKALEVWWTRGIEPFLGMDRERLLASKEFAYLGKRARVKGKAENAALRWDELVKDCKQALESLAPPVESP